MTRAEVFAQAVGRDALTGIERVLADQACVILDRLEELGRQIDGEAGAWFEIAQRLGSEVAEVTINAPLAEERQQAMALARVTDQLAKLLGVEKAPAVTGKADDLATKREDRRKAAGLG